MLTLVFACAVQPCAAADAPLESTELVFWQSSERIGTADAYRAYLRAFPNGAFTPLARAALAKIEGTAASPAQPAAAAAAATAPAALLVAEPVPSPNLRHFSEPPPLTGSTPFNIGDRFVGPGPLTVGWIGAKKQVLLPPGEWVVLAGADFRSDQTQVSARVPGGAIAEMVHLVLGRFHADVLVSALLFTTNIRPATIPQWRDVAGCDADPAARLHHARAQPTPWRSECMSQRAIAGVLERNEPAFSELRSSLARLGARGSGVALATLFTMADPRQGYLGVTRLDWLAPRFGAEADDVTAWRAESLGSAPARAAYARELRSWIEDYRLAAAEGFRRALPAEDLAPVDTRTGLR